MARYAYCDSVTRGTINVSAKTQGCTVNVSWAYNASDAYVRAGFRGGLLNPPTDDWDGDYLTIYTYDNISGKSPERYDWMTMSAAVPSDGVLRGSAISGPPYTLDRTFYFQAIVDYYGSEDSEAYNRSTSAVRSCKMDALEATSSAPYASTVAATTATLLGSFYPNTYESTVSAVLQYKKTSDSTWTQAGVALTGQSGYGAANISRNITGLTGNTQYQVRLVLTRTTNNYTSHTSSTGTFTTLADAPTITTTDASNVGTTTARLNCSFVLNAGTGCAIDFMLDATDPPATVRSTLYVTATGSYYYDITGLDLSTTYYYRAFLTFSTPSGSPLYGNVVSFSTTADPAQEAQDEARMQVYEYKRKYGVILTAQPLFFTLQTPSGTNSNTFVVGATVGAADCLISKDGGAFVQTTNQPVTLGNGYTLVLTATEMQANEIDIVIKDASGGPDFRDAHLRVITNVQLGSVDIDASTGAKSNTTALRLRGYGSGNGLEALGGATGHDIDGILNDMVQAHGNVTSGTGTTVQLADGYAVTNDYYNGAVILFTAGTGAGQARVIIDYVSDGSLTLNKTLATSLSSDTDYVILAGSDTWAITPGAELSALPTYASGFGAMLQFVFQRFAYQRTQSATEFKMFKANGSDALAKGAVDDSGTLQTHNILTIP
jgi:hypothetical protein